MSKIITQLDEAQAIDRDNDYIVVRQTTATGNKTRRMKLDKVLDVPDASIASLTATVNTLSTSNDAKIPLSQKGAVNGVATLDGSGKVPASQLTIIATSFQGNWDASTNSPTLADGTGTGGDFYFVQNGASVDLGSGANDWTTGAMIIYNGSIWVENEAVNEVLAVNGQTGNVSLTTEHIDPSTDRNYLTDGEKDALTMAQGPLGTNNHLISRAELDTELQNISDPGIIIIGGILSPQTYSDGVNTSGTGEKKLLSTLGYTDGTAADEWPLAAAAWGGTITAASTSLDDVEWQSALWALKSGVNFSLESLPNKAYAFERCGLIIPNGKDSPNNNTNSAKYEIDFRNAILYNRSGAAKIIFLKEPEDQDDADTNCIDNQFTFKNGKFRGPGGTGDMGMKISATRSASFENLEFQNHQYGIYGAFLLNCQFNRVNSISCSTAGLYLDRGWWSGANYANSGNQPRLYNCRFRMTGTTQIGCKIVGPDSGTADGCTVEGTAASYGFYIDTATSTVSKNFRITGLHAEIGGSAKFTDAVIGFNGRDFYTVVIDQVYNQAGVVDTVLLDATNTQGTNTFKVLNCKGNTGTGRWKLRNINSGGAGAFIFDETQLQGAPQDAADVIDTDNFPSIWTSDSDVPTLARTRFTKCMV